MALASGSFIIGSHTVLSPYAKQAERPVCDHDRCRIGSPPPDLDCQIRTFGRHPQRVLHEVQCAPYIGMPSGLEFAVGLRDEHASDWVRSVSLLPERKRQFTQPPLDPICLDVRKVLTVATRCALVGAALGIGMRQDILAADLVVQGVEAITGLCLRFRVQRRLQFLNTLSC